MSVNFLNISVFFTTRVDKMLIIQDYRPDPIVNSVCPGYIRTNIAHAFGEKNPFMTPIIALFFFLKCNPADVGARSLVKLGNTAIEEHGKFKTPDEMDKYEG